MWKFHVFYESQPRSVIITLRGHPYRVLEVVLTTTISSIFAKKCQKVISQTVKFVLFMIRSKGEQKVNVTTTYLTQGLFV
jgi:hypothetical protein